MRLTVVTPSILRSTLAATIESVRVALEPGDQHLVIINNVPDGTSLFLPPPHPMLQYIFHEDAGSVVGNAQRDAALSFATGDCLVYLDDDDVAYAKAYDILHDAPAQPNVVHYFEMVRGGGIFRADRPRVGEMGGPQCVPPMRPDLPRWMGHNVYEADGHFIVECAKRYESVVHNIPIALIRPRELGSVYPL